MPPRRSAFAIMLRLGKRRKNRGVGLDDWSKISAIDLGKTASAADVIYDALRDAIIRGELREGATLRQDNIAQIFNVSRIPVREALKKLEVQGLATSVRYKGVVVAAMSVDEISEIFEFRALVEPKVIELAVPLMSAASLEKAQACCDEFAAETRPARWGDINRQFHATLYADSGRPYYLSIVNATSDRVERYTRAQLGLTHGMERARAEHQAIMDACARRDAKGAARLTRDHILNAGKSLIAFLREKA